MMNRKPTVNEDMVNNANITNNVQTVVNDNITNSGHIVYNDKITSSSSGKIADKDNLTWRGLFMNHDEIENKDQRMNYNQITGNYPMSTTDQTGMWDPINKNVQVWSNAQVMSSSGQNASGNDTTKRQLIIIDEVEVNRQKYIKAKAKKNQNKTQNKANGVYSKLSKNQKIWKNDPI